MTSSCSQINVEVKVTWFLIEELPHGHPLLKIPAILADGKQPSSAAEPLSGVVVFAGNVIPSSELPENCPFTRKERILGISKPYRNALSALTDDCIISVSAFQCVAIPPEVSPSLALVAVLPALRTLAALEQVGRPQGDVTKGTKSALIVSPHSANQAMITAQICGMYGIKPLVWLLNEECMDLYGQASSDETSCSLPADLIVMDEYMAESELPAKCLASTGNVGVDMVMNLPKSDAGFNIVSMQTLIRSMAIQAHIVTSFSRQHLSAANQESLLLKSASMHFLCELSYILSPLQIGTYQDMVGSVMRCLRDKLIVPISPKIQELKWSSASDFKPIVLKAHQSLSFVGAVVIKLS